MVRRLRSAEAAPTSAQLDLMRIVAERHGLALPPAHEIDGDWVRRFLDCFAYDPESEQDVFRRIRNIAQYVREGRDLYEMALRTELTPEQTGFVIEVLRRSGFDLEEVVEDLSGDPEEDFFRRLEMEPAEAGWERF